MKPQPGVRKMTESSRARVEAERDAMRALELRWADRLDAVAREFVSVENKFAMNGAYASAAEQAAYRHGIERSAWLIRNRPDEGE